VEDDWLAEWPADAPLPARWAPVVEPASPPTPRFSKAQRLACERKTRFPSAAKVKAEAIRRRSAGEAGVKLRGYHCPVCDGHHLTSQPA
jgi:hypothetical protein